METFIKIYTFVVVGMVVLGLSSILLCMFGFVPAYPDVKEGAFGGLVDVWAWASLLTFAAWMGMGLLMGLIAFLIKRGFCAVSCEAENIIIMSIGAIAGFLAARFLLPPFTVFLLPSFYPVFLVPSEVELRMILGIALGAISYLIAPISLKILRSGQPAPLLHTFLEILSRFRPKTICC